MERIITEETSLYHHSWNKTDMEGSNSKLNINRPAMMQKNTSTLQSKHENLKLTQKITHATHEVYKQQQIIWK